MCGFDLLRADSAAYVADVNSWSMVRSDTNYHYECANALRGHFFSFLRRANLPDMRRSRAKDKLRVVGYISIISYVDTFSSREIKVFCTLYYGSNRFLYFLTISLYFYHCYDSYISTTRVHHFYLTYSMEISSRVTVEMSYHSSAPAT